MGKGILAWRTKRGGSEQSAAVQMARRGLRSTNSLKIELPGFADTFEVRSKRQESKLAPRFSA